MLIGRYTVIILWVAMFLFVLTRFASADVIEIQGQLHSETKDLKGQTISSSAWEYAVYLNTADFRWRFRMEDQQVLDGRKPGPLFTESGTDGKDVYYLAWFSEKATQKAQATGHRQGVGTVQHGLFPEAQSFFGKLVWLAFCSGGYFSGNPDVQILHFHDWKAADNTEPLSRSILNSDLLRLPQRVEFLNPGFRMIQVPQPKGPPALDKFVYPQPYDAGFISAVYQVLRWHEVQPQLSIPQEFSFEIHALLPDPVNNVLVMASPRQVIVGTVKAATWMKPETSKSFLPLIPGPINVSDLRFRQSREGSISVTESPEQHVFYSIDTQSGWILRDTQDLEGTIAEKAGEHSRSLAMPQPRGFSFAAAVLAIVILPAVIYFWRIRCASNPAGASSKR